MRLRGLESNNSWTRDLREAAPKTKSMKLKSPIPALLPSSAWSRRAASTKIQRSIEAQLSSARHHVALRLPSLGFRVRAISIPHVNYSLQSIKSNLRYSVRVSLTIVPNIRSLDYRHALAHKILRILISKADSRDQVRQNVNIRVLDQLKECGIEEIIIQPARNDSIINVGAMPSHILSNLI